ncbi:MAG: BNR repeat domain protein [Anaerolineae bacterium]|nr:MAG: BNR repeat domain protein [Anaerolineae bacterium]
MTSKSLLIFLLMIIPLFPVEGASSPGAARFFPPGLAGQVFQPLNYPAATQTDCTLPSQDLQITGYTRLCPGTYNLPDTGDEGVLIIAADDAWLDCNNASLVGDGWGSGISVGNYRGADIRGCTLSSYSNGIHVESAQETVVIGNELTDNKVGLLVEEAIATQIVRNFMAYNDDGIILYFSDDSVLEENISCSNREADIRRTSGNNNRGIDNECDVALNWNDEGQRGCMYVCGICRDTDHDGVCDSADNCPINANPDQSDVDGDGKGDVCDNCPAAANASQSDQDFDSVGDVCDNCPSIYNPYQENSDGDSLGNACDNCIVVTNPDQKDDDSDGYGNVCDNCPAVYNPVQQDHDADGVGSLCDNCVTAANPDQANADGDSRGNACDNCWNQSNSSQDDSDSDCNDVKAIGGFFDWALNKWLKDPHCGDACDNCPKQINPAQEDRDRDGQGDHCDCNDRWWGKNEVAMDCGGLCPACQGTCFPILTHGNPSDKIDILISFTNDYANAAAFREDALATIEQFSKADVITQTISRFNFWYVNQNGSLSVLNGVCIFTAPDHWQQDCPHVQVGSLMHTLSCIDNARGNFFSFEPTEAVFTHEAGHAVFLLGDEYDDAPGCTTSYSGACSGKYCNIFSSQDSCKNNSTTPAKCAQFTTCENGWWKSQPPGTVMQSGLTRWGADAERQVWDIVNQYKATASLFTGQANSSPKAIVAYFHYDGISVSLTESTMLFGDSPERFQLRGDLRWELTDRLGNVLYTFFLNDPRAIRYYPVGGELIPETDFGVVIPFLPGLYSLGIYRSEDQRQLAEVSLDQTIRSFCTQHATDSQCQRWLAESWVFLPLLLR